ncbi:MAG: apolipoprotein N-acyltransferase [Spirochaetota bacterium]
MQDKILNFFRNYYYILSGFLVFLSFPTYDIWFLKGFSFFAWISLVPLLVYIREKSYKEILWSSFIAGIIWNYLVYGWIGDFGANVKGGDLVIQAFMTPSLTVFFVTKILMAEYFSRQFEKCRIFIYPSIWIFIDWIESIGFLAFPWTYWGYSQFMFTPFIQLSSLTGVMGITFILILANNIFADFCNKYLKQDKKFKELLCSSAVKKILALIFFVIIISCLGQYVVSNSGASEKRDLRIAVIQSCISPWENWNQNRFKYLENLEYYTKLSLEQNPDILIWSESATLEHISYHYANGNLNEFERRVLEIARSAGKPLVTGEIGVAEEIFPHRRYPQNNAVLISEKGEVVDTYAKIHLVPFGEWFPYEKWFPFLKELLFQFGASNFVPGREPLVFQALNRKFGVLICYEGIFYKLCRKYKNSGSEFLINITNLGWTDAYAGHIQQFAASRFRAIENGVWFISASNSGITGLIDPYGRIVESIPRLKQGYLVSDLNINLNHPTFYSKYGDIIIYFAIAFIIVIILTAFYKFFIVRIKNNYKSSQKF